LSWFSQKRRAFSRNDSEWGKLGRNIFCMDFHCSEKSVFDMAPLPGDFCDYLNAIIKAYGRGSKISLTPVNLEIFEWRGSLDGITLALHAAERGAAFIRCPLFLVSEI